MLNLLRKGKQETSQETEGVIMEGMELFTLLSSKDSTKKDALLVGKNIFNQHPSSESIFNNYFNYLCQLASDPITTDERKFYANEADIALAYFSENVKMTENTLLQIKECKALLEKIINDIIGAENTIAQDVLKEIQNSNTGELNKLVDLKARLLTTSTNTEFDSLLHEVQKCESNIDKKYLSKEQNEQYDALTAEYSSLINDKMLELERMENVEYNKLAVESFKRVLDSIQSTKSMYKDNKSQLFAFISENLFSYDATRLFNETIVYYNHVYSFIFNKVDEDGKYRLTQLSIDQEKR